VSPKHTELPTFEGSEYSMFALLLWGFDFYCYTGFLNEGYSLTVLITIF